MGGAPGPDQIATVDELPGNVIGITDRQGRIRFSYMFQQNPYWAFPLIGSYDFGDRHLVVYHQGDVQRFRLSTLFPNWPFRRASARATVALTLREERKDRDKSPATSLTYGE